jgi:hypothetical protein
VLIEAEKRIGVMEENVSIKNVIFFHDQWT